MIRYGAGIMLGVRYLFRWTAAAGVFALAMAVTVHAAPSAEPTVDEMKATPVFGQHRRPSSPVRADRAKAAGECGQAVRRCRHREGRRRD